MKLVIANKTYSSWSMRPWLLMRVLAIPFDEVVIPLDQPHTAAAIAEFTPAGKVPVLIDDAAVVWESLAIIDHLAERLPHRPIWPDPGAARALARSVAAEMHAGFGALRRALPMNMRREARPLAVAYEDAEGLARDIRRIEHLWQDARSRFGSDGDFLFGTFGAADAMFAPVVHRLHAYAVPVAAPTRRYMDAMMALPAWGDWQTAADAEGWHLPRIDDR